MKNMKLLSVLAATAFLFTGCIERENKNHPPFEPTVQTDEQRAALKKLEQKTRANYEANKKNSVH